jgi:hypothetical protein
MKKYATLTTLLLSIVLGSTAYAATGLDAFVDKNGYLDVQALTCGDLANTYQEDANALAYWYSGWYNGLAKKHFYNYNGTKNKEHEVIVFCKEHRDMKVIKALDVIFKEDRAEKKEEKK